MTPPPRPDHVLPGLIEGARRSPPTRRPTRYAAVSVVHTTISSHSTRSKPSSGTERSQTKAIVGSPINATPMAAHSEAAARVRASTPARTIPKPTHATASRGRSSAARVVATRPTPSAMPPARRPYCGSNRASLRRRHSSAISTASSADEQRVDPAARHDDHERDRNQRQRRQDAQAERSPVLRQPMPRTDVRAAGIRRSPAPGGAC